MTEKATYRMYWLSGAGLIFLAGLATIIYLRRRNQTIADNIMKAISGTQDTILTPGAAIYGDSRDLGVSQVMKPDFWRTNPGKVTIWAANADGSEGPAIKLAKQIHEANASVFSTLDKPGQVVLAFRALKSKEDVSKLADVFGGLYKEDLYTYLTKGNWLTNGCDPDQDKCFGGILTNYQKQIYDIIKNLN